MNQLAARALARLGEAFNAYRTHQAATGVAVSNESDVVDEANPLGKSPEEVDRSNRWFGVALAMGKQNEFVEMLATERRLAVAAAANQTYTLLDLRRAEDAGEICAMEDATQSVMCLHEPLHTGPHSWQPHPADDEVPFQ